MPHAYSIKPTGIIQTNKNTEESTKVSKNPTKPDKNVRYSVGDLYVVIQSTFNESSKFYLQVDQYVLKVKGGFYEHLKLEMSFKTRQKALKDKVKEINILLGAGADSDYLFYVHAYLKKDEGEETTIFSGNLEKFVSVKDQDTNYQLTAVADTKRLDLEPMFIDYGVDQNPVKLIEDVVQKYNEQMEKIFNSVDPENDEGIKNDTKLLTLKTNAIENEDYKKEEFKIKDPLIQYNETYWNFFKRIGKNAGLPVYQEGLFLNIGIPRCKEEEDKYIVNLKNSTAALIDKNTGKVINKDIYKLGDFLGLVDKQEAKYGIGYIKALEINMKSQAGIECTYEIKDVSNSKAKKERKADEKTEQKAEAKADQKTDQKAETKTETKVEEEAVPVYNKQLETIMGKLTKVAVTEKVNFEINEILKKDYKMINQIEKANKTLDRMIEEEEKERDKKEKEKTQIPDKKISGEGEKDEEKTKEEEKKNTKIKERLEAEIKTHNRKIETHKRQKEVNNKYKRDFEKEINELSAFHKEKYATGEINFGDFFKKKGVYYKKLKKLNELDGNYSENIKRGSYYFITNYQNSQGKRDFGSEPIPGENVLVKFIDNKEGSGIIVGAAYNKNDGIFLSNNVNLSTGKANIEIKEDLLVEKKKTD